jgi:FKBP-type peptidyl-prolyl cis-trans isomerase FkpA
MESRMKTVFKTAILAAALALPLAAPADNTHPRATTMTLNGMAITDTQVGTGTEARKGNLVVVHYTGWLYDPTAPHNKGDKFDSSLDRGQPFSFRLGAGQVIRGWDEGFSGMKTGGKRTLVIPPEMGYGSRGAGGVIPPNATLIFDVELLEVR